MKIVGCYGKIFNPVIKMLGWCISLAREPAITVLVLSNNICFTLFLLLFILSLNSLREKYVFIFFFFILWFASAFYLQRQIFKVLSIAGARMFSVFSARIFKLFLVIKVETINLSERLIIFFLIQLLFFFLLNK